MNPAMGGYTGLEGGLMRLCEAVQEQQNYSE